VMEEWVRSDGGEGRVRGTCAYRLAVAEDGRQRASAWRSAESLERLELRPWKDAERSVAPPSRCKWDA
jgi:hypothetical protein